MIAVLALLPMRRRAFATLELGSSVLVTEDRIEIVLSGEMTKNGVPWEASVPKVIEPLLRRHIEEVRPYLLSRGSERHDFLWTDSKGRPLQPGYLSTRIGRAPRSSRGLGFLRIFSGCGRTTLAQLSPKAARLVRPLLGHASFGVAERCYNHATTIEDGVATPRSWPGSEETHEPR
jgi:hypothetical protein